MPETLRTKQHILTVALEDYFQVGAFKQLIHDGQWYRFDTRLERNTERALDLLDGHGIRATFFVLGWVAERFPELVRKVADRGHEIASKGYLHRGIRQMSREEFRDDLARSREAIELASGSRVLGYRVAHDWFGPEDLWALEVLAEEDYAYDSSIAPTLRRFVDTPWRRFAHVHEANGKTLWELPISSMKVLGCQVPMAGGNYFRQLPNWVLQRALAQWDQHCDHPLVSYFHVWELDPEQPKIEAASWLNRIRHYRNLDRMQERLDQLFRRYRFTGVADYLGLNCPPSGVLPKQPSCDANENAGDTKSKPAVSIVVPCYNEENALPLLANTLQKVRPYLGRRWQTRFVFVDDGSKDGTWETLQRLFGAQTWATLVRLNSNQGLARAILTGIQHADTEIVCSMDCDCTYDPHHLDEMIPLLDEQTDLVTASPYHPLGEVRNVPGWRLFLSRGASFIYRRLLKTKLHTYTSCFRVYRKSAVEGLEVQTNGYLGIAEIIGLLDLQGARIVEHPATLEVRVLGRSKMKTARTILGHLSLMARFALARLRGTPKRQSPPETLPSLRPVDHPLAAVGNSMPS